MIERSNLALRMWHVLNNQVNFFTVLKRNLVELNENTLTVVSDSFDAKSLDDRKYIKAVNDALFTDFMQKSANFVQLDEMELKITLAIGKCSLQDKNNAVILLSDNQYYVLEKQTFLGQVEYNVLGNFPGTKSGFIAASINSIPIMPVLEDMNEIFVLDTNNIFIGVANSTFEKDGHFVTQLELVCTDPKKHYKIILE